MTTYVSNFFSINGAIDTNKPVLDNLNDIATAVGAFITYDVAEGKWAVIINTTGTSVASFNDTNIIGNLDVSGKGVKELYNSATIQFPNRDLRGAIDYVDVSIADADKFANELENRLNFSNTIINDSAQAQYIASVELKQNRVDKMISFRTDYSYLNLKAGDLIDITNAAYGYTNKVFRIVKIEEDDNDGLQISITALEYDANVYDTSNLTIANRTKRTKIQPHQTNTAIAAADDTGVSNQLNRLMLANVALGLLNPKTFGALSSLYKMLTGKTETVDANGNPIFDEGADKILGNAKAPSLTSITGPSTVCEGQSGTITVGHNCSSCLFDIPDLTYTYTITGISDNDISIPLTGKVKVSGGTGTLPFTVNADAATEGDEVATFTIGNLSKTVTFKDAPGYTYTASKSAASITEGGSVTITLVTTGTALNATIPYTISGTASGKVSSPALTGTVTASGGNASLVINTTDDSTYQGTQGLTISFGSGSDPCGLIGTSAVTVSVLDNDSAPPAGTTCQYVTVPVSWCGSYEGGTDQLYSMTANKSASFPVAQAGEPTVQLPLTVTVTKGNPSTIAVASYATVAQPIAPMGGIDYKVITSFNTVVPKGLITGTTTTVTGI